MYVQYHINLVSSNNDSVAIEILHLTGFNKQIRRMYIASIINTYFRRLGVVVLVCTVNTQHLVLHYAFLP